MLKICRVKRQIFLDYAIISERKEKKYRMRARVVLYNPQTSSILLIHRIKNGRDYWVIPGGGSEKQETPVETAVREINEELALELKPEELKYLFTFEEQNEEQFVFLTKIQRISEPEISGEEKDRASEYNVYQPKWVSISEIEQIDLMPPKIAKKIKLMIA